MKFQVGDKVMSIRYPQWGVGTVVEIDVHAHGGVAPVKVDYEHHVGRNAYSFDGTQPQGPEPEFVRIRKISKLDKALK